MLHYKCMGRGGCGETKNYLAFQRDRSNTSGRRNVCKVCAREKQLRSRYGLSLDDFELLYIGQMCKCLLCGLPLPDIWSPAFSTVSIHVDHCARNGHVRALLHPTCNLSLGHLESLLPNLPQVLTYLRNNDRSWHEAK